MLTQVPSGMLQTTAQYYGFKNRLINGGLVISQYNGTNSTTPTDNTYVIDRWVAKMSQNSKYSTQQVTTAPVGFNNSLKITSLFATTIASTDYFLVKQIIEGYNMADLGWGTANAKTITLSFQVYSSLTGTFSGALWNIDGTRSYPYSYTISSANTWTPISITIPGDTAGTWNTTNGAGCNVSFGLGAGSSVTNTAGSWYGAFYAQSTGSVNLVATNNATFYFTAVQLEVGTQATSFDYRPYGTELQLCQRYYYNFVNNTSGNSLPMGVAAFTTGSRADLVINFPVTMRTAPALVQTTGSSYYNIYANSSNNYISSFPLGDVSTTSANLRVTGLSVTAGQAGYSNAVTAGASTSFNSEL